MVGHVKYNNVFKILQTETGVTSINWTQFKQGRATRWGLAWTHEKNIDLVNVFDHLKPQNTFGSNIVRWNYGRSS